MCRPKHYHEPGVGAALAQAKLKRADVFVQTKFTSLDGQDRSKPLPYDPRAPLPTQVQQSVATSLKNLGVSYIDSVVLHSPMRTHADTMTVWRTLEAFTASPSSDAAGAPPVVRQLGVSNIYDLTALQKIYEDATVKPAVVQNRFYGDTGHDVALRAWCVSKGIYYQSFWTLTANPNTIRSDAMRAIARAHGTTPAAAFFAFLFAQPGFTPLTGTTSEAHMRDDLGALDVTLTEEEQRQIAQVLFS